jgi:hypothetical protein
MAKYRLYKNGIYGHRYRDFYIVPCGEDDTLRILTDAGEPFALGLHDLEDCEWFIDLVRSDSKIRDSFEKAYTLDIGQLNCAIAHLTAKKLENGFLPAADEDALTRLLEMKRRKAKNKPFWPQAEVVGQIDGKEIPEKENI